MDNDKRAADSDPTFIFKPVPIVLSLLAATLIGWAISLLGSETNATMSWISCSVISAVTLVAASSSAASRIGVVIKSTAVSFFIIGLVASWILSTVNANFKAVIITDGLIVILLWSIIYSLYTRRDV